MPKIGILKYFKQIKYEIYALQSSISACEITDFAYNNIIVDNQRLINAIQCPNICDFMSIFLFFKSSHIDLTFNCFILGAIFFFSLLFSLSSIFLCFSGSSISLILSFISRLFLSRSSAAFSALAAWIDLQ